MCGRFAGFREIDELMKYFPIDRAEATAVENYNVAPSQPVLTVIREGGENVLETLNWGLVPFWAKDKSIDSELINARMESVHEKPSFRNAFRKRRCLILADGFYEWTGPKGDKQPVFITLPDGSPFAFAGLWEEWREKGADETYRSCTIITGAASESVRDIHHRMPLVLTPGAYDRWLDTGYQDVEGLRDLLDKEIVTEFKFHKVSKQVNKADCNDPSNLAPVET